MNRKEERQLIMQLADLVAASGSQLSDYLKVTGIDKELITQIHHLEKQGDQIRDKLDNYFKKSKGVPYLALEEAELMAKLDAILDAIVSSGHSIDEFGHQLPKGFVDDNQELYHNVGTISQTLADAIKSNFDNYTDTFVFIDLITEQRDEIKSRGYQLMAKYFQSLDNKNGWKQFVAIQKTTYQIFDTLTLMKDATDILKVMNYKHE